MTNTETATSEEQGQLAVEEERYCANCGGAEKKHDVKTPLGFGYPLSGCLQFVAARIYVSNFNRARRIELTDESNHEKES